MKGLCLPLLLGVVLHDKVDRMNPTAHALDRWKASHVEALKRRGPVAYERRDVTFYAQDVQTPDEGSGPATSAVVRERTTLGGTCTEGLRELTLSWKEGDDQATVDKERLMGEDCCDLDHCAARTAGGWMTHLRRVCAEGDGQEPRLAALVDRRRGVTVYSNTRSADRVDRWKQADADSLCNLDIAKFTCAEDSPRARWFTCETEAPLEHYHFSWRRTKSVATIEVVRGILED